MFRTVSSEIGDNSKFGLESDEGKGYGAPGAKSDDASGPEHCKAKKGARSSSFS